MQGLLFGGPFFIKNDLSLNDTVPTYLYSSLDESSNTIPQIIDEYVKINNRGSYSVNLNNDEEQKLNFLLFEEGVDFQVSENNQNVVFTILESENPEEGTILLPFELLNEESTINIETIEVNGLNFIFQLDRVSLVGDRVSLKVGSVSELESIYIYLLKTSDGWKMKMLTVSPK